MKKLMGNKSRTGLVAGLLLLLASTPVVAMAPPVEVVLGVIGQGAEERREGAWTLRLVDEGVATLSSTKINDEDIEFQGEERRIVMRADADAPWNLLWAMWWSSDPSRALDHQGRGWTDESGRVEVVDDELAYCYGSLETSRLCVDSAARRILVLAVEVDGVLWELRSSGEGQRLQITADGSLRARISARS